MAEALRVTATPPAPAHGKEEAAAEGSAGIAGSAKLSPSHRAPFGSALSRGGCPRTHVLLRRRWGGAAPRHGAGWAAPGDGVWGLGGCWLGSMQPVSSLIMRESSRKLAACCYILLVALGSVIS